MSKRSILLVSIALLLIAAGLSAGCSKPATTENTTGTEQSQSTPEESPEATAPEAATPDEFPKAEAKDVNKLIIKDVKVGTGAEATPGKSVTVNYTGWLTDGTKFDSSKDSGQPFVFPLGAGQVIKGWDEGVAGMKVGGKRILVIPPDKGYGEQGAGGVIPPNATLVFTVELLDVQ